MYRCAVDGKPCQGKCKKLHLIYKDPTPSKEQIKESKLDRICPAAYKEKNKGQITINRIIKR